MKAREISGTREITKSSPPPRREPPPPPPPRETPPPQRQVQNPTPKRAIDVFA